MGAPIPVKQQNSVLIAQISCEVVHKSTFQRILFSSLSNIAGILTTKQILHLFFKDFI